MEQDEERSLSATNGFESKSDPAQEDVSASDTIEPKPPVLNDWDGPDDPGNPKNWSLFLRLYGVFMPAWYSFSVTFGTSVYAAGVPGLESHFHVSRTAATVGLSLYAIGLAFGPAIGAPISETLGRRWTYLLTLPCSLLFTMGAGLATNIGTVFACRFLASLLGAPALAVGAGSVADLWDMQGGGAIAATLFVIMPFLGTSLGPLVGGFAVQEHSWRWSMWTIIMIGGPAWLLSLPMRETHAKMVLKKRARVRGVPPPPKSPPKDALKMLMLVTLVRPIHMLLTEPIIGFMSLYNAFAFGLLFAFFDAFPYVFETVYSFNLGQVGLTYLGITCGIFFAAVTFGIVDKTLYARAKLRASTIDSTKIPPPEERLYACMMGSIGLPVSLFWFGWTSRPSVHWIVPILAGIPFGWGLVLLFLGTSVYLVDTYMATNAASATAANNFLRFAFAAGFPLFTTQMYAALGIGWAASLSGFIAVVMLPIPWMLYRWGPALRRRSSYKTGNFCEWM